MQRDVIWGDRHGLIRSWKFQPGAKVLEGDILALVEPVGFQLLSPVTGTLVNVLVRNNTKVEPGYIFRRKDGAVAIVEAEKTDFIVTRSPFPMMVVLRQVVCVVSTCTHPILTITDVCTTCHVQLYETSEYAFYITPSNHPIKRRVLDVEAESESKKQALLASRRLVLVLDLDQTVLHAALLGDYRGELAVEMDPKQESVFAFELSGNSRMIVKFRPGLREFLLEAHKLYEIHVYTMANAEYASKIVDLINTKIQFWL